MLIKLLKALFAPADEGGGGAPTPAAPATDSGGQGLDWGSLTDSAPGTSDGATAPVDAAVPSADPAAAPAATPPAAPPTPQQPPATVPPVAPQPVQPPVAAEPPQQPQPAAEDPLDPQWQEKGLQALTTAYGMSAEQREAFEADPTAALPALAARVHMNMLTQVGAMIDYWATKVVPQMITQRLVDHTNQNRTAAMMETRVFSKYDKLREVDGNVMRSIAQVLRKKMPNADFDTGMAEAARIAYGMYGWELPGSAPSAPQPSAAVPVAPPPYSPVQPGSAPPPVPGPNGAARGGNLFADLIDPR